jgi:glycosyltransferase involved in cell wall biosynthesis
MKISVALCCYNGEKFIRQQLDSILKQKIRVDEIIVCDDGSIDNTLKIIEEISKKYTGIFSIHANNKNIGTIKNFEKSISLTTGDIIFLSDQDDIWNPDKTEKIIEKFMQNSEVLLIFSNGELIDQSGLKTGSTLWDEWSFTEETRERWKNNNLAFIDLLSNHNKVTGATVAFRKILKDYVIPIQVPQGYWHDAFLSLLASALNGLYYIEECLINYRIHKDQQIGIPNGIKEKFNKNNFSECISNIGFLLELIKKVKPWNLRIKIISYLINIIKGRLTGMILCKLDGLKANNML